MNPSLKINSSVSCKVWLRFKSNRITINIIKLAFRIICLSLFNAAKFCKKFNFPKRNLLLSIQLLLSTRYPRTRRDGESVISTFWSVFLFKTIFAQMPPGDIIGNDFLSSKIWDKQIQDWFAGFKNLKIPGIQRMHRQKRGSKKLWVRPVHGSLLIAGIYPADTCNVII